MGRRRKQPELIQGHAAHRRTEGDYMRVLLDTVTLDDWRDVIAGAKAAARAGDAQARAWLAQYLMGRPKHDAPTPLTVVVNQLRGADPLVNRLAKPLIDREKYPSMHASAPWEAQIRAQIAAELAHRVHNVQAIEDAAAARVSGASADTEPGQAG